MESCCYYCTYCKIIEPHYYGSADDYDDGSAECTMDSDNFNTTDGCRWFEQAD